MPSTKETKALCSWSMKSQSSYEVVLLFRVAERHAAVLH